MRSPTWETAFTEVGWTMPIALAEENRADAVGHLEAYFATNEKGSAHYSGALFEKIGGGGDREGTKNDVTGDDWAALSTVNIRNSRPVREVMLGLLTPLTDWERQPSPIMESNRRVDASVSPVHPHQVSRLLAQIPVDVELSSDESEQFLLPTAPGREQLSLADQLWFSVRRHGFGQAGVSKLLARKRPRLFPIIDSYVVKELNHRDRNFYSNLRGVLRHDDHALEQYLREIRDKVHPAHHLSILRVFDIVVWRSREQRSG